MAPCRVVSCRVPNAGGPETAPSDRRSETVYISSAAVYFELEATSAAVINVRA